MKITKGALCGPILKNKTVSHICSGSQCLMCHDCTFLSSEDHTGHLNAAVVAV